MAVIFDLEAFGDLDAADAGDAPGVVAAQIEQHQMFGPLLGICQQLGAQGRVFGLVGPAPARAGQGSDGDALVARPHQDFRAGAHHREAAEIQIEQEGRGVHPAQGAVIGEGRQGEGHIEALGEHHLEGIAGGDVVLRLLHDGEKARAGGVGDGLGRAGGRCLAAGAGQGAIEGGAGIAKPLAGLGVSGAGIDAGGGAHRCDDGHLVGHIVEDRHHGGAQQQAVRHIDGPWPPGWQALDQADHLIADIAHQRRRHRRQFIRQVDMAFAHQPFEGGDSARLFGDEGVGIAAGAAVDLGLVAAAAPDEVRFHADDRIAPAHMAAFDRFQQEGVGLGGGDLQHRRDRRLQVGDRFGPHHLRLALSVARLECLEIGRERHGLRRIVPAGVDRWQPAWRGAAPPGAGAGYRRSSRRAAPVPHPPGLPDRRPPRRRRPR